MDKKIFDELVSSAVKQVSNAMSATVDSCEAVRKALMFIAREVPVRDVDGCKFVSVVYNLENARVDKVRCLSGDDSSQAHICVLNGREHDEWVCSWQLGVYWLAVCNGILWPSVECRPIEVAKLNLSECLEANRDKAKEILNAVGKEDSLRKCIHFKDGTQLLEVPCCFSDSVFYAMVTGLSMDKGEHIFAHLLDGETSELMEANIGVLPDYYENEIYSFLIDYYNKNYAE